MADQEKALAMENAAVENTAVSDAEEKEEVSMVIKFKKPYVFEKKEYTELDLSGMEDMTGADMIAVNKIMSRHSVGIDVMPEVSVEYAFYFAARATKLPLEFFTNLPPKESMKVKNRVMGFLFGSE